MPTYFIPLIVILFLFNSHITHAGDWPNWLGPNRDGISTETDWDPKKIDSIKWKAEVGIGFSSVSISNGKLYTMGHNGNRGSGGMETVYCLNANTGKEIWTDTYKAQLLPYLHEGGPTSTPTVHNGSVYTLSKDGRLIRYNADSGKRLWEEDCLKHSSMDEPAEWGFASSPLILGDMLVVEAAQTLAFNKDTGSLLWKSETYRPAYGTPTAFQHNGKTYLATLKNDGLVILDATNGKTVAFQSWRTRFRTNGNTPIVRDNLIFISTGYQRGCGLYRFTGSKLEEVYTSKNMSNHMSNSVLIGKQLYGFDGNTHTGTQRELKCIDFATGKERWAQGGLGIGAVTATGNRLIILSERGELVIAKATPEAFTTLHRAQVSGGRHWNVPVLANGYLYVRNAAGRLTAIYAK